MSIDYAHLADAMRRSLIAEGFTEINSGDSQIILTRDRLRVYLLPSDAEVQIQRFVDARQWVVTCAAAVLPMDLGPALVFAAVEALADEVTS